MKIEIWSDVVCPWCAVGRARFRQALAGFPHADEVSVRWRSFELDPNAPIEREGDYVAHLARKYGASREQAQQMIDRMTRTAAEEGLEFRFDRIRPGNTFDAHRILHLAAAHGLQDECKERFLRGYLTEGQPIGRPDTLTRLATEVGLDAAEVADVLASDRYAAAVRDDERRARELDITGVPCFVVDGTFAVPGAQPSQTLQRLLLRMYEHGRAPVVAASAGQDHVHEPGEPCTDGVCAV